MNQDLARAPQPPLSLRGYFAIGAERISKSLNLGNLMRSAHGFGASFTFTIGAPYRRLEAHADTSKATQHLPHFDWQSVDAMALPKGCRLVGIELIDGAVDLPSFCHPLCAAYVLGAERGELSPDMIARCHHIVRIPAQFSVIVAMAGAIVMYDRVRCLGRFPPRPIGEGAAVPRRGSPQPGEGDGRH